MKLLVIGPRQSNQLESEAGQERAALQAAQVERYTVMTPQEGEGRVAAALRILRESGKENFDTVSAQDPFFVGLIAWCIARRRGSQLNVQVHADLAAQPFMRHVLAQIVLRHADSVRVVSEKIKHQVERMGVTAKITVLPMYLDLSRFRAIERRPEQIVLWVGRFEWEKDPLRAIEVIKKVPDAKLILLGKGALEQELRQKAKGLNVEFAGWTDPLPYLARAAVVLSTSPAESYGVSIVEALAAGVPVVSQDVGVAREAGAIVVPRERLAEAVSEVLRSGARGELKLSLLSKEEWVRTWRESL